MTLNDTQESLIGVGNQPVEAKDIVVGKMYRATLAGSPPYSVRCAVFAVLVCVVETKSHGRGTVVWGSYTVLGGPDRGRQDTHGRFGSSYTFTELEEDDIAMLTLAML